MALIDTLKAQLVELFESDPGWVALFNHHGWAFDVEELRAVDTQQLVEYLTTSTLDVDFTLPGFEDFHSEGQLLVCPGIPSQSLLYHALASPNVIAGPDGFELMHFASLALLDTLENFIFSVAGASLQSLEQRAREQLGLIRDGETFFQFVDAPAGELTPGSAASQAATLPDSGSETTPSPTPGPTP